MLKFMFGVFIILHGLVHLLYFGHSQKFFELQAGMVWPDGSWAFSRLLGNVATRNLASISLVLTAIALVAGGIGTLLRQGWWRPIVVGGLYFPPSSICFCGMGNCRDWIMRVESAFSLTWRFLLRFSYSGG